MGKYCELGKNSLLVGILVRKLRKWGAGSTKDMEEK
jgi:hypothetical protein